MLDLDTLKHLSDLTANTLYDAEVARLPNLSPSEVEMLIVRARQGDNEARKALIVSCLSYALGVSRFVYHERRPQHDDLLDLVQEASERMTERLDRALATSGPVAYLRGIARRAISDYCTYHSGLIQKPEYALAMLEKLHPHPATIESLDTPLYHDGERLQVDLIEAPVAHSNKTRRASENATQCCIKPSTHYQNRSRPYWFASTGCLDSPRKPPAILAVQS